MVHHCWVLPRMLRAGGLRRALLATVLGVVVLSVMGMHQLSLDHDFVIPPPADHQHADDQLTTAVGHELPGHAPVMDQNAMGMQPEGMGGSSDEGCPGCAGHGMAFSACLLALTLLILSWWLLPPRVRHLLPRMLRGPTNVAIHRWRRVPAMSLAALCVLRM